MAIIGALISAGLGIGSAVAGGIAASRAAKKAKNIADEAYKKQMGILDTQREENQEWFDREYYADPTQRADAQRLLTMTQDAIKQRNKAAAGAAAMMGGTEESVAATKAANAKALADATSNIAADNERRKAMLEQQYQANKMGLLDKESELIGGKSVSDQKRETDRAAEIIKATNGASNAFGGLSSLDELLENKGNK